MWVLWQIGRLVERLLGNVGFVVLYVVSGIGGSLASLVWHQATASAGASGAAANVCRSSALRLKVKAATRVHGPSALGPVRTSMLLAQ